MFNVKSLNSISAVFLSLAFLSGCSHLASTIPTPIVESPELSGKENVTFGADVRAQAGIRYRSTSDASYRPPNLSSPEQSHMLATVTRPYLDFFRRFRLGVGADLINGGYLGSAQVQVLGQGRSSSKIGDVSFSIFGHAGSNEANKDGDQNGVTGAGGNPWSAKLDGDWHSYGASIGYKFASSATVYGGAAFQKSLFRTTVTQTGGSAPTGTYKAHEHGNATKALVGVSWGTKSGEIFVTADYTESKFDQTAPVFITSGSIGAAVDFN